MNDVDECQPFESEDTDGNPIVFEGIEIGWASSRRQKDRDTWREAERLHNPVERQAFLQANSYKSRWLLVRIIRTRAGAYVVEITGQTTEPDEVTRRRAHVLDNADDVILALEKPGDAGQPTLTYTARRAITKAAEVDPDMAAAWEARTRVVA